MTSSILTLIHYRFLCTALELIPNYGTSRGKKITEWQRSVCSIQHTHIWLRFKHVQFWLLHFYMVPGWKKNKIQNAHQKSATHITHIFTHILVQGGWCESDRRKLQERSAWANGRGSLHDITPDTFDRSFNVTTQPLTPSTDVTGKPGRVCCTWTCVSVCMCAF